MNSTQTTSHPNLLPKRTHPVPAICRHQHLRLTVHAPLSHLPVTYLATCTRKSWKLLLPTRTSLISFHQILPGPAATRVQTATLQALTGAEL